MDNKIENFVSYASFLEAIEKLPTEEDKAKAALALLRLGHTGEWRTEGNILIEMLLTLAAPNIIAAKNRYSKAVEKGSRGGRPKVDRVKIAQLKEEGLTSEEIADEMGCSTKTVSRALQEIGRTKLDKRQNHNIDIDIDNNIDTNKERQTDSVCLSSLSWEEEEDGAGARPSDFPPFELGDFSNE